MPSLLTLILLFTPLVDEPQKSAPRIPDRELPGGIVVELLTEAEAKISIVDESDPFFDKLSLLEISLRLDRDVTDLPREKALAEFKTFLIENVTDWPKTEADALLTALPLIAKACRSGCPKVLPKRWRFIRTTGREESGAPYTRGDCIVLPAGIVEQFAAQNVDTLGKLIVHESFHVYSRLNPIERDTLYAEIGFQPIEAVKIPEAIDRIRLTNPDGPGWEHSITVRHPETDKESRAVMLLTSRTPVFQKAIRGVIPALQFHLYPVTDGNEPTLIMGEDGEPVRWYPFTVPGFQEKVGKNTGYIIHPDEILADNVSLLAYPDPVVPTPELLERLKKLLSAEENPGGEVGVRAF